MRYAVRRAYEVEVDPRKKSYEKLCNAVGQFVLNWAEVDRAIDYWIMIIYHDAGGKKFKPEIPEAFDDKQKFLRKCFKRLSTLEPFSKDCLECLKEARRLSKTRHAVVHGTLLEFPPKNDILVFGKVRRHKTKTIHYVEEFSVTSATILQEAEKCMQLGGLMLEIAEELGKTFVQPSSGPFVQDEGA